MKKSTIVKIALPVVIILAFVLIEPLRTGLSNMTGAFQSIDTVTAYIRSFEPWSVVISFLMMILQSLAAPIPAFLITLSNAVIWGWKKGALLSWTSSMTGAALCFIIARFYGRNVVEKFVSKKGLDEVEVFFEKYGKNTIIVARLLPFVPFDPISYAAGLTSMKFIDFFIATGIGQLPATIIYSYGAATSTNPQMWVKGLIILFGVAIAGYTIKKVWDSRNNKTK